MVCTHVADHASNVCLNEQSPQLREKKARVYYKLCAISFLQCYKRYPKALMVTEIRWFKHELPPPLFIFADESGVYIKVFSFLRGHFT